MISAPLKKLVTATRLGCAVGCLSLSASMVQALGLGDLTPSSSLGQPLSAAIAINQGKDENYSPEELRVRQLSARQARGLGIDLAGTSQRYRLTLQENSGQLRVQLSSSDPINEPFLNLLVELKWPAGTVYREYTLLLDPPGFGSVQATPATTAREQTSPARLTRPAPELARGSERYRVNSGDSLSTIAARLVKGSNTPRRDMMNWLLANNPRAFKGGDMNHLLAGATLTLPKDSVVPPVQPQRQVTTPLPVAPAAIEPSSAEPAVPAPAVAERERLSIVTPNTSQSAASVESLSQAETILALRDTVVATQELADRLKRENEIMEKRLQAIERSGYLSSLERLVKLKEEEILALKTQLQQDRLAAPANRPGSSQSPGISQTLAERWWLWGLLIVALLGAGYFFSRWRRQSSSQMVNNNPVDEQALLDQLDAMASPASPAASAQPAPASKALESTRRGFQGLRKKARANERRSEEQIKESIRQKTNEYIPNILEGKNESDYDALDRLISEALTAANRGNFGVAEAMLLAERTEQVRKPSKRDNDGDTRLEAAIEYVEQLRQIKYSQHFQN